MYCIDKLKYYNRILKNSTSLLLHREYNNGTMSAWRKKERHFINEMKLSDVFVMRRKNPR